MNLLAHCDRTGNCLDCEGQGGVCLAWRESEGTPFDLEAENEALRQQLRGAVDLLREARALLLETTIGSDEWERRREAWMKRSATTVGGQ